MIHFIAKQAHYMGYDQLKSDYRWSEEQIHSKGGKFLYCKKYVRVEIPCLPSRTLKQSVARTFKRQTTINSGTIMSFILAGVNVS